MMKRMLLSLVFLTVTVSFCFAQQEQSYYEYARVRVHRYSKKTGYQIVLDNGKGNYILNDEDNRKLGFYTPAGALNYLVSYGWELYQVEPLHKGDLPEKLKTTAYWIMRRPCTKEKFEELVKSGIKTVGE